MKSKFYSYLMSLGHVTADLNQGALSAVLPFIIAANGYDYTTAGSIVMFYSIVGSFVQPIFGQLADKHFSPWVMPLSLILACGGMAFTGLTSSYWVMVAAAMISGIGVSMFHPGAALILNKTAPEGKLGECLSIFSFGGNMGFVVGPVLAGTSVAFFGLKGTLVLLIPVLIADTLLILKSKDIMAIMATNTTTKKDTKAAEGSDNWSAFSKLCLVIFGRSIIFFALNTYILLYWIDVLGQTKAIGGTVLSCFFALSAFSTLMGGRLADKYGFRTILRLSYLIMFPSLLLFSLNSSIVGCILCLIPMGLSLSLGYSPQVALSQKYLPNHLGLASGISLGLSVSIGGIMIPLLGKIADLYGLNMVFYALAIISIVPLITSFCLPDPEIKKAQ